LLSTKIINIYPDTMVWMRDFSYSYNEPMMHNYFAHPGFGEFPVVGVSWDQAQAFCWWRTSLYRNAQLPRSQEWRLPSDAEWEYAARGGRHDAIYPWGGPYIRDYRGCFLANFKPMRGNYTEDGYLYPCKVANYIPNDFGLYDMAGNVAEWTVTPYDDQLSTFTLDMNPHYNYKAKKDDPAVMRRKVVRGGSWKDVAAYLQCASVTYEYQNRRSASIGFRCVRSYIGN
ncbi:type IX secretion system lipoprotein PorK/GldK, partial [Bacteroides heparinolyticus]|uniref:type IX secretion system lipoprotein PorK/GldK n=1 Tax=Prevotella heparinolytica TaxID=28113 RepID=UPI0035A1290A